MPPIQKKQTAKAPSSKRSTTASKATKSEAEGELRSVAAPALGYNYTNFASSIGVGKEINGITVSLLLDKLEEIEPERKWRSQEEVSQIFEFNPTLSVIEFAGELADCGVAVGVVGTDMYVLEVLVD